MVGRIFRTYYARSILVNILQKLRLTSSGAFPMNFPFFHQVIVAGGRDPLLLHTSITDLDTDNGSSGLSSCTVVGSTRKK